MLVAAGVAFAGTITSPSGPTFAVPGDGAGNPLPFDVTATGFTPGQQIFVTQCDGLSPSDPNWSVATDCDFGTAPGPVPADENGAVTFTGTHHFVPFKNGDNAQGKFNCIGPNDPASTNGEPDWTNCRLRVSSNNTTTTADQAFLVLTMPNAQTGSTTTSTTVAPETTTSTTLASDTTSTTVEAATTTTVQATGSTTTSTIDPGAATTTSTVSTSGSTVTTLATARVAGSGISSGSGALPFTGSAPAIPLAGAGGVLVAAGLALAGGRRRRGA